MSKLDIIAKEIGKKFGESTIGYGVKKAEYDKIKFTSPRLNYMTFGGLATGRIYEFAGPEGSGKTTSAFDLMKNAQIKFQKEYEEEQAKGNTAFEERKVFFLDEEGTFDAVWARKFGVNVEKVMIWQPQGESAEKVLDVLRNVIETGEVGLAILDSIATLVSEQVYEESLEKKAYGGIAATLTRFVNLIKGPLLKYDCTLIMINQVREDLGSMFGGTITPGGRAFKHACSARFEFRKGKFVDDNGKELTNNAENPAGNIIHVVVKKTKIFEPTRRVGYYTIKYLTGPDFMSDYIDVGLQTGVINQRGAFYNFINPETGEILNTDKIQGRIKLKEVLAEHPEWIDLINNAMEGKKAEEVIDADILAEANKLVNTSKEE
jgi:recombination protein RecA